MDIDETDRKILYLLQEESRPDLTHDDIAARIGVSSSTVGNRLNDLKESGVLVGYLPQIDYERAGVPHHVLFICTAPISERGTLGERAIDVHRVVSVQELLSGRRNMHIEAVCLDTSAVEEVATNLHSIGLKVENSEILRRSYSQPFNDFGEELVDGPVDP